MPRSWRTAAGNLSVYDVRMARVNITVPDDLLGRARSAGLNVSRLSAIALAEELDRRARIAELDAYLSRLDTELGPTTAEDRLEAQQWADRMLPDGDRYAATGRRTDNAW